MLSAANENTLFPMAKSSKKEAAVIQGKRSGTYISPLNLTNLADTINNNTAPSATTAWITGLYALLKAEELVSVVLIFLLAVVNVKSLNNLLHRC